MPRDAEDSQAGVGEARRGADAHQARADDVADRQLGGEAPTLASPEDVKARGRAGGAAEHPSDRSPCSLVLILSCAAVPAPLLQPTAFWAGAGICVLLAKVGSSGRSGRSALRAARSHAPISRCAEKRGRLVIRTASAI